MNPGRRQFDLEGRLQGVGFRPHVYRLAQELKLVGWVRNTPQGVSLEVQGLVRKIEEFEERLKRELPVTAFIRTLKKHETACREERGFHILASESLDLANAVPSAEILPDLATCPACVKELDDPANRRYRYPFTHCTDCGPRYSILKRLPFDRANTTMAGFSMCSACRAEYQNPSDRRFHAQSICCADCGPSLYFKNASGQTLSENNPALCDAAQEIRQGAIVAVQGVGGFHLVCDARQDAVVRRLRLAKRREAKPFALMAPSLERVRELCQVSPLEERLLLGPGAPIVLLDRGPDANSRVSPLIAPGAGSLGVMLPYSPMHRLLMAELGFIVVATSGNLSEEPICHKEKEALLRLRGMADFFLVHNRPIASRIDDSVVRKIAGTEVVFRAGRGYAPLVLEGVTDLPPVLALGSHQKNALAFARGGRVVLMPHLGNLDSLEAADDYQRAVAQVGEVQELAGAHLVCDLHPDYHSTRVAQARDVRVIQIQHHEAHLLSCVAEHGVRGPIFGVAWDGTGFGPDGMVWGGEFFKGSERGFSRVGHLRPFKLPGGSAAVIEPRRAALGLLYEVYGPDCVRVANLPGWCERDAQILMTSMARGVNSPKTSSAGRLFDVVAAILGICGRCDYEGQAATELEYAAAQWVTQGQPPSNEAYPVQVLSGSRSVLDWEPWIRGMIEDRERGQALGRIAAKFHQTLARAIVEMSKREGIRQVVLSGGCFQNRLLSEWAIAGLEKEGFQPYWNQKVPPNDGGISVGQVMGGCNVLISTR